MTAERKFNAIILAGMVALVFSLVGVFAPAISNLSGANKIAALVTGALASAGTYRLLTQLIVSILRHSMALKKFILGAYYMEGTWVGHFIGHNGNIRYVVEVFEQELDTIVIRGYSFASDGTQHAQWTSEAVHMNAFKGKLTYTYMCDVFSEGNTHQGVGVFDVQRKDSASPPSGIHGYVTELATGKRLPVKEIKMNDQLLTPEDGLEAAKKVTIHQPVKGK